MPNDNVKLNVIEALVRSKLQHYNEKKYWSRREKVLRGGDIYFYDL